MPVTIDGTTGISGPASGLTDLNASNLSTGTVPDARFPATLPAASGANLTSLNASNLSTGTVGTARLGSGTANSTTYLRGDQTWATVTSLPGAQGQVFTSSGTFTVPSGITAVQVTVIGGGGGGGSARIPTCGDSFGGHGGGAGVAIKYVTGLTPGGTVSVTVGAGGTGGVPNNAGGAGGTSSFGAHCSATGGGGGGHGFNSTGAVGSMGSGSGGSLNLAGVLGVNNALREIGYSAVYGGIATNPVGAVNGNQGVNYGSGGTGGRATTAARNGGAGSPGIVIVEW